jgi:hypothetical protein
VTLPVPAAPALATVPGVELMRAGQWQVLTGPMTVTRDDLASAVAALDCPAIRRPVLKLGHVDPRFDGEPAVGWIDNMLLADSGNTIVGDYVGMPGWLGDVIASAYPDRSIEGWWDWRCQLGHTHPFMIEAVALLGVTRPGIGTLQSLQDVADLYGVTASTDPDRSGHAANGQPVTVTIRASKGEPAMPNPRPSKVAAGVTVEDVRRAYYEHAPYPEWICEIQLDPLQLIVVDDASGSYYRVPVAVDGDVFGFGDKVEVKIRYEDVPADGQVAASVVFASRAESRPALATVSDTAWSDFSQADYDVAQWHRACLVHTHDGAAEAKGDCKLPVREPSGALNRNGVHAAASRIGQLKGVTADDKKAAAKKLVGLYRSQLKEDPPDSLLTLAGMAAASTQTPPVEPAAGPTPTPEGASMPALDEGLRERLSLPADADEAAILAAVDELTEAATAPPTPTPEPVAASTPPGTVLVDETQLADLRAAAEDGRAAREQQRTEARDAAISAAIGDGKIPPARKEHWEKAWAADPDGTRQTLASLAPGLVPVADLGTPGGDEDLDGDFDRLHSVKGA